MELSRVRGKITITAQKIVDGRVTGNNERPAIPTDPDAATIKILNTKMDDFEVKDTGSDSSMRVESGALSGELRPCLAANIPKVFAQLLHLTSRSQLQSLQGEGPRKHTDRDFDTDIGVSNIDAIIGLHNEGENRIGMIRVWVQTKQSTKKTVWTLSIIERSS